jgi:hypothetical protein
MGRKAKTENPVVEEVEISLPDAPKAEDKPQEKDRAKEKEPEKDSLSAQVKNASEAMRKSMNEYPDEDAEKVAAKKKPPVSAEKTAPSDDGLRSLSEEQRAELFAHELAPTLQNVSKIKLCYDKVKNEWWYVFYEDAGMYYDLKQFHWNIEQEKPEQFLVLKRISKNELQKYLGIRPPGKICRVFDPDPNAAAKISGGDRKTKKP